MLAEGPEASVRPGAFMAIAEKLERIEIGTSLNIETSLRQASNRLRKIVSVFPLEAGRGAAVDQG